MVQEPWKPICWFMMRNIYTSSYAAAVRLFHNWIGNMWILFIICKEVPVQPVTLWTDNPACVWWFVQVHLPLSAGWHEAETWRQPWSTGGKRMQGIDRNDWSEGTRVDPAAQLACQMIFGAKQTLLWPVGSSGSSNSMSSSLRGIQGNDCFFGLRLIATLHWQSNQR